MTVADLQAYLTNLADAVAASTRSDLAARDLRVTVEGLEPFAALTIEALGLLLKDAQEYARTGKISLPVGKRQPRAKKTADELTATLESLRARAAADPLLPRAEVERTIGEFKYLPHADLRTIAAAAGIQAAPKMMRHRLVEALVKLVMDARPTTARPPAGGAGQGDAPGGEG